MDLTSILFISIGLAADSFAVSICKGLYRNKYSIKDSIIVGLWFGIFQALMPFIGYNFGNSFSQFIKVFDHWISFILLFYIGIKMILENDNDDHNDSISFNEMLGLAIATSIDALAVGVTFSFLDVNIYTSIIYIGVTAFIISFIGVYLGYRFGSGYQKTSRLIGGVVLILIGIKILIEHLFF